MRVASIDIGTNSVLLLIAEPHANGLRAVFEKSTITRLGQQVDRTGVLHPEAVSRTLECLRDYASIACDHDVERIGAVATSACRDASGSGEFLAAAERLLGVAPTIISGEREAQLTFSGALSGLSVDGHVAVQDIGGGSTEVVVGVVHGALPVAHRAVSLQLGCVRMTERFLHSDPPTAQQLQAMREHVRGVLAAAPSAGKTVQWVGIAGTITTLTAVALGLQRYDGARVHGATLTLEELDRLARRLSAMTVGERRRVPGLEPKRADVIVAGAWIAVELLAGQGASSMLVSDRGVRWGLAMQLAA